mmetsp:Transcript_116458/g.184312  ORF Transcript_116458/g.184312 Transcript_116458/m.184312 type:complete len:1217 (-) Transcript_116458:29-3679(-)
MQGIFAAVQELVDRFSVLGPGACGACQKEAGRWESSERVFALHPLSNANEEAIRHTQRGVRLLHEGRTEESLQELHEARQQAPNCHEACSNLGCAYHMSGDDNKALYWYRQASIAAPKDDTAVMALSLLEQRRGQVFDAQRLLVKYLQEVDSAHVGALKQLGRLHQEQGHWSQAGGCFHRLISIEPHNSEWPAQLQMCLDQVPLKDGQGHTIQDCGQIGTFARAFSFAEPILRQAIPIDSREAGAVKAKVVTGAYDRQVPPPTPSATPGRVWDQLSRSFQSPDSQRSMAQTHESNRPATCKSSIPSIQEDSPSKQASSEAPSPSRSKGGDALGVWSMSQSLRMGAEGDENRLASHARVLDKRVISSVLSAVDQLNRGSIQCPEGFLIVYSGSSNAYFLLYRSDTKDVAYEKLKLIMDEAPIGVAVKLEEAARLRGGGRSDAALVVYRHVLGSDPQNHEAMMGVADCQCDLGNIDAALDVGKKLRGIRPNEAEANIRLAELLLVANQGPDVAEPYLQKFMADIRSLSSNLQQRLLCVSAEISLARDDFAKGLASAAEAVRIDSSAKALTLLGLARLRVAEYPSALRALNAALDACSGCPSLEARRQRSVVHMLTAQAQERLRQYPQALAQAQAALELRPKFGDARVVKAMALQQSGRASEAEAELQQVLLHEPQHALARLQLGYLELLSSNAQAVSSFEAVVNRPGVSRSLVASAKVYLALALASNQHHGAEKSLKEGLALHRNLQHVWGEIANSLASQPTVAVQRLRGICDLDLTSQQARQLLSMLAQVHERADIARAVTSLMPPTTQAVRAPSVPPNRWAPTAPLEVVGAAQSLPMAGGSMRIRSPVQRTAGRSVSPGQWAQNGNMQRAASMVVRGRSVSPGYCSAEMYSNDARQRTGSADSGGGSLEPGARGRQLPSSQLMPVQNMSADKGASTSITLGWDEVIRPEQLTFGVTLGAGGSASVYRGTWNGNEVAIKKISGLAHLEEMKKEINALRRLRHPRLVRFMGACIQPPQLLVVTEFMAGGSLYDRLFGNRKDPLLSPAQRWQICLHMAEGLAFLHSQRVVHRDLKSMNILLDALQNAKICDFGLAQNMEATHITRKNNGEGGSPRYMAPECYEPSYGKLTDKVDIWALGCILIELFGNKLPYEDCQSMAQLSARILVERRPPDVPLIVEAPLREVTRKCLEFDERRRINAGDLHAELNKVRGQLRIGSM